MLKKDEFKKVIISSLQFLVNKRKIKVYGFVIMPNHIHLIWEMLEFNGKELPNASFMKFTGNEFFKILREKNPNKLKEFEVNIETRVHQFWIRDSLAVHVYTPVVIYQKLEYIHNNPVQEKWFLSSEPATYEYSSAKFYEAGIDKFDILTHIGERIRS